MAIPGGLICTICAELETILACRWGARLPQGFWTRPALPRIFLNSFTGSFPGTSLTLDFKSNPAVPGTSPEVSKGPTGTPQRGWGKTPREHPEKHSFENTMKTLFFLTFTTFTTFFPILLVGVPFRTFQEVTRQPLSLGSLTPLTDSSSESVTEASTRGSGTSPGLSKGMARGVGAAAGAAATAGAGAVFSGKPAAMGAPWLQEFTRIRFWPPAPTQNSLIRIPVSNQVSNGILAKENLNTAKSAPNAVSRTFTA